MTFAKQLGIMRFAARDGLGGGADPGAVDQHPQAALAARRVLRTRRATLAGSLTSTSAKPPSSSVGHCDARPRRSRSKIATFAPASAKARATAAPSPEAPPVTTAVMSLLICIALSPSLVGGIVSQSEPAGKPQIADRAQAAAADRGQRLHRRVLRQEHLAGHFLKEMRALQTVHDRALDLGRGAAGCPCCRAGG